MGRQCRQKYHAFALQIINCYPDPSGVSINSSTRYITLERNLSIQQTFDISAGVYNLTFNFAYMNIIYFTIGYRFIMIIF